jgi:predicted phosphoribosyltransferase
MVTTVPSGSRERDERHPLPGIVGYSVEPTKDRYARLLERTPVEVEPHVFSREKYAPIRELSGESVLLLDDTWTRGASMQSAAATLKAAGAGAVGAMVIGRYVRRDFDDHAARVDAIRAPFDWTTCWHHND